MGGLLNDQALLVAIKTGTIGIELSCALWLPHSFRDFDAFIFMV